MSIVILQYLNITMESAPLVRIVDGPNKVVTYDSVHDGPVEVEVNSGNINEDYESERDEDDDNERPPHRFHYTFDDRTIDEPSLLSQYFDMQEDGEGSDDEETSLDLEDERVLRRVKSYDAEESIYFDAFADEILPREEPTGPRQRLSPLALSVLVFYNVSGGPFGMEGSVRSGGPFFAILGFLLFPLVWSIPEALVTAELGTAYPEPSGSK